MEGGNTMDWLDGFGIFYIIGGITIILVFAISYLLKKRFPTNSSILYLHLV